MRVQEPKKEEKTKKYLEKEIRNRRKPGKRQEKLRSYDFTTDSTKSGKGGMK